MGHYASEMRGDPTPEEVALEKRWTKIDNKLKQVKLGNFTPSDLPLLNRYYERKRHAGDLEALETLLKTKRKK